MGLLIGLISGAIGGNVAGKVIAKLDQGMKVNSICGVVGGWLGASVLELVGVGTASGAIEGGAIAAQIASGGIGGVVFLAIIGAVRKAMAE